MRVKIPNVLGCLSRREAVDPGGNEMAEERLQKLIARSGICSRREADDMVQDGRVTVNGQIAKVGTKADPEFDHVKVDGRPLRTRQALRYILLYKPRGVMTTCDDPEGRKTVIDLITPTVRERVFPVGRLDFHSEGLILLTNDGDFAAQVTHPRYGVVREYVVKIRGDLTGNEYKRLMAGTMLEDQHVKPKEAVRIRLARGSAFSWWRVQVAEGRTHEVRELFFRAGHHVQRLRRTAIGPLRDDQLKPGFFRELIPHEIKMLKEKKGTSKKRRQKAKNAQTPKTKATPSKKRS